MTKDRPTSLLDEFAAITAAAPRPAPAGRASGVRTGLPVATLAGAVLIVAVVAAAGLLGGRPGPLDVAGGSPSVGPTESVVVGAASPSIAPEASAPPEPSGTPKATAAATPIITPEPTAGPCDAADLAVRITSWDGAAGSRIGTVALVHRGTAPCLLEARNHPQFVGGDGGVLIDGRNPVTTTVLTLEPGATVSTQVSVTNYCGPDPLPPVSVAFVLGNGQRIVAAPAAPDDATVPPCNGPSQPGAIDMHPWAR